MAVESNAVISPSSEKGDLVIVDNLVKYFPIRGGFLQRVQAHVKAVDGVSFTVRAGETLGLVGESGCGKTTVGRTILGLIPHDGGSVFFEGQDVLEAFASRKERGIQTNVWGIILTALVFLLAQFGLGAEWVVAFVFILYGVMGLWGALVATERGPAIRAYTRRNGLPWAAGTVLGLVWFRAMLALLDALGQSEGMSLFISVVALFVIGWVIHSRFGKIIEVRTKALRRHMQIVFQDPYSSLDPRVVVGESIGEGLLVHGMRNSSERYRIVMETLDKVGMKEFHARRYPHEFSGGQRQRIGIARALALGPKFIVCDEPVSALDVSIQAQVLNILKDLQRNHGFSYLFIAHNLSVVEHISDRVAVMYLGKMVELSERHELFENPLHPYTQALMSAIPVPDPTLKRDRIILKGDVPSPVNPPSGCRFHPRCPVVMDRCSQEDPAFKDIKDGHFVACWRVD